MQVRLSVLFASVALLTVMAMPFSVTTPVGAQTIITVTPTPVRQSDGAPRPTATPLSATARETERLLSAALARTAQISTYQMDVTVRAAGVVAGARGAREEVLIDFRGEYNGADSAFVLRTPELDRQGVDPATGVTAARVNGVTYALGPLPIHGVTEPVWYGLGTDVPSFLSPPYRLDDMLRRLGNVLPLAEMARGRTETIDGRRCTVYQSGVEVVPAALGALGQPLVPPASRNTGAPLDLNVQRGTVQLWLCNDGMLRRIQAVAAGNVRQQPSQVFSTTFRIDIGNINGKVTITTPAQVRTIRRTPEPIVTAQRAGPIRSLPGSGRIVGQVNIQDAVIIIERSADQRWYRVRAPAATGWVSVSLLSVPQTIARRVPVASS
ncbi:MAG: SH3 domain-containing protein [Roseiflexus sp.]